MDKTDFDWYEDATDGDTSAFTKEDSGRSTFEVLYNFVRRLCTYITLVALSIFGVRYVLSYHGARLWRIDLNFLLLLVILFCGSLWMIGIFVGCASRFLKTMGSVALGRHVDNLSVFVMFALWHALNLYLVGFLMQKTPRMYRLGWNINMSGLVTSCSFGLGAFVVENCYIAFLRRTLSERIRQVDVRESILSAMKNHRYDVSQISISSESYSEGCLEFQFYGNRGDSSVNNDAQIYLRHRGDLRSAGKVFLPRPEVSNIFDAQTLAKDVFVKASGDGENLTFDEFSSIFPNRQVSLHAFAYFDTRNEQVITQKEFRDTLLSFFVERLTIEKSIKIAQNLFDMIKNVLYIIISCLLVLVYLIIFDVSLKDLFAFIVSSALVLNFVASGTAKEMYYNVMFVLSHQFDIGDDIVIDGMDMKVLETGLSNCAFLASNGGKIKFLNSELWEKVIVNMTRAPEKRIVLEFTLGSTLSCDAYRDLNVGITSYLKAHNTDFFERFSLEALGEGATSLIQLQCRLILTCRTYKTKAKKFYLRIDFSQFLRDLFRDLGVEIAA